MSGVIERRLTELKIELPQAPAPVANYVPWVVAGDQLYIAGQVCVWNGQFHYLGRVGSEISLQEAQRAARMCGLNIAAQVKAALGDLDLIRRCVKLNVFVNSSPSFTDQPSVANGASDLMVEIFGEAGKHARSAVGVWQLPRGVCVEIDAIFSIASLIWTD